MSSGLRVSILGGGSAYTPGLVEGFIRQKPRVPLDELVLMDIDPEKLQVVGRVVQFMVQAELPDTKVTLTSCRDTAIRGVDFIICQIRVGGLSSRHLDESIPTSMGMVGQETTGPGGFAMALRTIPVMVEIAQEIEEKNPSAWLINYTNPTGLVAEAIGRTSFIKHISICDEPMILQELLSAFVGVQPERLFFDYFGLNHLAWARRVLLKGRDILPSLRKTLENAPEEKVLSLLEPEILADHKTKTEVSNTLRIFKDTGLLPSPYLQYYCFTEEIVALQKSSGKTRAEEVIELERSILADYDLIARGKKAFSIRRGGRWHADMMVGMLGTIAQDKREIYIVNVPNRGAIPDLPYDKIVEVPAVIDASGAHPLAMGHMPQEVRGLIQKIAKYEQLTVESSLEGSIAKGLEALRCHPLVCPDKSEPLLRAYLAAHSQYLPQFRKSTQP